MRYRAQLVMWILRTARAVLIGVILREWRGGRGVSLGV